MGIWQQFGMVALAHFLALLSPGPDFLLILRATLTGGLPRARGVCFGIALANAVYIGLAASGVTVLREQEPVFVLLRWAGGLYLAWLGWRLLHSRGLHVLQTRSESCAELTPGWQEFSRGFLSGILNPKNALFYASLFALIIVRDTPVWAQSLYGIWMFAVVLGWDLLVAAMIGRPSVVQQFIRHVSKVERLTGGLLLALAAGILGSSH